MTEQTVRLALPLIAAGQAQKEIFHNEALTRLDALVHGSVEAAGLDVPPGAPAEGAAWIVGAAPGGAWAGQAGAVAWWSAGGWRFAAPREGMMLWVRAAQRFAIRGATDWAVGALPASQVIVDGVRVVGARQPAIAAPAGGTVVDGEARAALSAVLAALRAHGLIAT